MSHLAASVVQPVDGTTVRPTLPLLLRDLASLMLIVLGLVLGLTSCTHRDEELSAEGHYVHDTIAVRRMAHLISIFLIIQAQKGVSGEECLSLNPSYTCRYNSLSTSVFHM